MKKFFIFSIIVLMTVIGALVAKEKGLFIKIVEIIKGNPDDASKKSNKKEIEPEKAILDMDGFVIPVVKNGKVIASLELSFKVLVNEKSKPEFERSRSVLRARMTSMIYDYIDKYYEDEMDLEKLKQHMLSELQNKYGKKVVLGVLYAFYYIRPAA